MKENIHIKINSSDKKVLTAKASEFGLSLSAYIRLKLKEATITKEIVLRDIMP